MHFSKSAQLEQSEHNNELLNYLSESDNEESGMNKGGGFNISTNLLCPSTFIKLFKSERHGQKRDLMKEKKQQQLNSMNK